MPSLPLAGGIGGGVLFGVPYAPIVPNAPPEAFRAFEGSPDTRYNAPMFNLISLVIGVVALFPLLIALTPFFGALNWLILPLPVIGLAIGALSRGSAGRNLNAVVLVVAVLRLMLGHGIF